MDKFSRNGPTVATTENSVKMQEVDSRFENQDRMINYLIQQINSMENNLTNNRKQLSDLQERDRDNFLRAKHELTSKTENS